MKRDGYRTSSARVYSVSMDLAAHRHSLKIEGIYADGFDEMSIPRGGWGNLLNDISKIGITHIVMPNLSKWDSNPESLFDSLTPLLKQGVTIVVAQAPFINGGLISNQASLAQAVVVIQSAQYYRFERCILRFW